MKPVDPLKVNEKITELNGGANMPAVWIAAQGLNALTAFDIDGDEAKFNPNYGIPIQVFVNTQTGEVKIFDARAFQIE